MSFQRITPEDSVLLFNLSQNADNTQLYNYAYRLWELENQITKGEWVNTKEYYICPEKLPSGKERYLICKNGVRRGIYDFADTIEEAEQKLKELQDKE